MISFQLNGQPITTGVSAAMRLSDFLRDTLGLWGTKVGCNAGDCGSCTVLMDGDPICSCLIALGQLDGAEITTVEGFVKDEAITRLQDSFLAHGAAQCGICTPGMIVSAAALLKKNPNPNRAEIEDALAGVLCRCTGYNKITEAVFAVGKSIPDSPCPEAGMNVGTSVWHLDGRPKVEGSLCYGYDKAPAEALLVRVIRSPHHHASFDIGNKRAFLADNPGIMAVLDATDIPGRNCFGVIPPFADQPVFAEKTALFRGEAVAALVGTPESIKNFDESQFPISWQVHDSFLTSSSALAKGATQLHKGRHGNILVKGCVECGDADAALKRAVHSVEVRTTTPFIEHAYIETEAGYAVTDGDRLVVYGCTQAAQMDRESLAEIMNMDLELIRVVPTACGGGFGSKLDLSFQPYVALASLKLRRPTKICFGRGESMKTSTKRHPSDITVKVGCDESGRISGFSFDGIFNTGAYASWGPTVANRVPVHASGPYETRDYIARSAAVHTNTSPAGAFRGFGVPQSAVAQEIAYDLLAEKVGMDRLAFRRLNALRNGIPTVTGQVFQSGVGIDDCFNVLEGRWREALEVADEFNLKATQNGDQLRRGVGIASCWYGCGNTSLPNPSTIRMGINKAGCVFLHQGAMDIGQGSNTVISQIAADAFGIPVHTIELLSGDTDLTPDCGKTSASRQTFVSGKAALLAGKSLREMVLRHGNLGEKAEIRIDGKLIHLSTSEGQVVTIDLSRMQKNQHGYVFMSEETYDPPTSPLDQKGQGVPYAVFGYGAQIMELFVDCDLGKIELDRITTAHDVGKAINPMLVEGQIEGGVAQGIGMALMENYVPGKTENLHDYLIPTIGDMPKFEHFIVEVADEEGPYGAKGLGEHVLIPTAPAIVNAVRHATGACIHDLPITPDKVCSSIAALRQDSNVKIREYLR